MRGPYGKADPSSPFWTMMATAERGILRGAMAETGQRIGRAARLLGIDIRTFKLRAFGCEAFDLLDGADVKRFEDHKEYHARVYEQRKAKADAMRELTAARGLPPPLDPPTLEPPPILEDPPVLGDDGGHG